MTRNDKNMGRKELTSYIVALDFEVTDDAPVEIVCILEMVIQNYKNKFKTTTERMTNDMAKIDEYKKLFTQKQIEQFEKTKKKLPERVGEYGWSMGGLIQLWCLERYGVQYDKRYKRPSKL